MKYGHIRNNYATGVTQIQQFIGLGIDKFLEAMMYDRRFTTSTTLNELTENVRQWISNSIVAK